MRKEHHATAERLLSLLLAQTKLGTIEEIYRRVAPGQDGRIRTVLSPVGTETGRYASSESFLDASTNLQNLPKKVALLNPLYDVRRCLVPTPGRAFVEVDLSQAEARATSAYAADHATLAIFASGADIHRWTASRIFGVAEADINDQQRHLGKMARHALNYGMGWSLFLHEINKDADLTGIAISAAQAKDIVEGYRRDNPLLLQWWDRLEAEVWRTRALTNCYGRRRVFYAPEPRRTDIAAFLPQSTIADMLNNSLVQLWRAYDPHALEIVLQIHDAVLMEVEEHRAREVAEMVKGLCESEVDVAGVALRVPADVSIGWRSWGEMEKVKAKKAA